MKLTTLVLAAAMVAGACGGSATTSSPRPSPSATPTASPSTQPLASASPSASPVPVVGAFGVLVTPLTGNTYAVSLIGVDGTVAGSAQASPPTAVTCGDAAAAVVPPPISTSNSRAYYMDAQGVIRFLTPQGDNGRATTVPAGGQRRSMFAVSPDDQRIAVVVADYTAGGATTKLYVEDLNGGTHHVDIFSETGVFTLWPTGWHGGSLVVAKVPACTPGGGPFSAGPRELHVVDPATAIRRFTIGSPQCVIAGPPSPAGAVCEDINFTHADVFDWTAGHIRSFPIPLPMPAYLSPDGHTVAVFSGATGATTFDGTAGRSLPIQACGWIDDTHIFSGGDAQSQPRVGDITTGATVTVAALGICAGRLPGGL